MKHPNANDGARGVATPPGMEKTMKYQGAIAVITGGASGIGKAAKERFEANGATAVSWDLKGADIYCDVSDPASIDAAIAETLEKYGVPTILVASAGVGLVGSIADISFEDWNRTYDVNVRGVFLSVQAVVRAMLGAGLPGSIIIISSVNATVADPGHSMYSSSKAAVAHFARCAAVELGSAGIRVNAVAVGPTDTPMMDKALSSPGYKERIAETTPLGRVGTVEDIAEGIDGIISSDWITGQLIALDGGASLVTARGADRSRRLGAIK
ncbi:MAG: glucose 1-dehydrogenase [Microbacteriaceae bacterium]|nr:glucose 1-dehydrogenase [Microbacteriaceae bacterium]